MSAANRKRSCLFISFRFSQRRIALVYNKMCVCCAYFILFIVMNDGEVYLIRDNFSPHNIRNAVLCIRFGSDSETQHEMHSFQSLELA